MSSNTTEVTYINARCHCSANKFKIAFSNAKLPLASDLCHCTSCRHATGGMSVHTATMEGRPLASDSPNGEDKPADLSNLVKYNISPHTNRYFCRQCGAYMLYEILDTAPAPDTPHWSISAGSLERTEGAVKIGYHAFVGDTLDGGAADHFRVQDGVELPRYEVEGPKTLPVGWKADRLAAKLNGASASDSIAAYCHCRKVSLTINRAKDKPTPQEWWHVPGKSEDDPIRFMCGYCACSDCRLSSGCLFTPYLFALRANVIDDKTRKPLVLVQDEDQTAALEGLKRYESSKRTFREFCSTCGATVLYYTLDRRGGELLDVAAGLLDEEQDGARADGWLNWYPKISHSGSTLDEPALKVLEEGLRVSA